MSRNQFEESLDNLSEYLFALPLIREYFFLKEELDNDQVLKVIEQELRVKKKTLAQSFNDDISYQKAKEEYTTLKKKYDEYPPLVNFRILEDEVYNLLFELREILRP